MKVVILCGGLGTRAYPYTEYIPKPMLPIVGTPIVMHVMRIFAEQNHHDFVLALGYRREVIQDYFDRKQLDWNVELVDTGDDTQTGGRIYKCRDRLTEPFLATYSDGLADVPLAELVAFHNSHNGLATLTSVPMPCQYGTMEVEESGRILHFNEKPILQDHWINAGFFMFDPEVFEHWEGENLETEVFPALARKELLYTFKYPGAFKSMDSFKDQLELDRMVRENRAFWIRGTSAGRNA